MLTARLMQICSPSAACPFDLQVHASTGHKGKHVLMLGGPPCSQRTQDGAQSAALSVQAKTIEPILSTNAELTHLQQVPALLHTLVGYPAPC